MSTTTQEVEVEKKEKPAITEAAPKKEPVNKEDINTETNREREHGPGPGPVNKMPTAYKVTAEDAHRLLEAINEMCPKHTATYLGGMMNGTFQPLADTVK